MSMSTLLPTAYPETSLRKFIVNRNSVPTVTNRSVKFGDDDNKPGKKTAVIGTGAAGAALAEVIGWDKVIAFGRTIAESGAEGLIAKGFGGVIIYGIYWAFLKKDNNE